MAAYPDWTLEQWLAHMESVHSDAIAMGLERVTEVARRLECLRPAPVVVVVAGTNGKGTTIALLARLLGRQGLSVGCYNSPHLLRYNERVSLDGHPVSDAELCESFALVEQARGDTALTYFEFGTLAALALFNARKPDVCLLEIGLGGRLDAVNIVEADLAIVTSIGLDHADWLGDDPEVIAWEKCSIARDGKYLICGQPEAPARAAATVAERGGIWLGRGEQFDVCAGNDGKLNIRFLPCPDESVSMEWQLPVGHIPADNIATAIQTLAALGHLLPEDAVAEEIERTRVAGRLQQFAGTTSDGRQIHLILDVAHNAQAASHLARRIERPDGLLLAMLADKPVEDVVPQLPQPGRWLVSSTDGPRGLSADDLCQRGGAVLNNAERVSDVASGLQLLVDTAADGERWLVVGSFVTVEQALLFIQKTGNEYQWTSI